MRIPQLNPNQSFKENTEEFLGYNHNLRNKTGEWYDEKNMTTDYYPLASTRDKRGIQLKVKPIQLPSIAPLYIKKLVTRNIMGMLWANDDLITLREIVDINGKFEGAWFTNNDNLVGVNSIELATTLADGTYTLANGIYYEGTLVQPWRLFPDPMAITVSFNDGAEVYNIPVDEFHMQSNDAIVGNIPYWVREQQYGYLESDDPRVSITTTLRNTSIKWVPPVPDASMNKLRDIVRQLIVPSLSVREPHNLIINATSGNIDISKLKVGGYVELDGSKNFGIFKIEELTDQRILLSSQSVNFDVRKPIEYTGDLKISKTYSIEEIKKIRTEYIKYFDDNVPYKRSIVRNGANVVVFPDGVVYDTTKEDNAVTQIAKRKDVLSKYGIFFRTYVYDENISNFKWLSLITKEQTEFDSNSYRIMDNSVQQYLESSKTWVNVKTYVGIYSTITSYPGGEYDETINKDIEAFKTGDVVSLNVELAEKIPGLEGIFQYDEYKKKYILPDKKIYATGNWKTYPGDGSNRSYFMVEGYIKSVNSEGIDIPYYSLDSALTITRKCPDISFACESNNRVWGCSKDGHEIYASALGNPYTWYDFSGISTDSYAVNVGTEGEFTGCCTYLNNPLFFKEDSLHSISGGMPSQYSVATYDKFKGLEKGSERSLVVINNILYYKSSIGIVAFDGANTQLVSPEFAQNEYTNAVAGVFHNKYYVSMRNKSGEYELFSYDTAKRMWSREDNTNAEQFINVKSELIYYDNDKKEIISVRDTDILKNTEYHAEGKFEFLAETSNYGYSYPNNKYVSRFQIRMQMGANSKARFYIQYNSDGIWHSKGEMSSKGIKNYLLPIVPMRCDHMRIKIEGEGDVKIYSIAKILEEGGDVR